MKWIPQDMEMFLQAREYVDTAVMPLIGITFEEQAKQTASVHDFISIVSRQVEQQYKGRVLLLPPLSYYSDWPKQEKLDLLLKWKSDLDEQFAHVLFLTSDVEWKTLETELGQTILWTNHIPLEHLEEKYKQPMIEEQVKSLLTTISQKWKNE
ncbi:MAG: YpiF family protein [Bacillus sp. (in: firmicutes)]